MLFACPGEGQVDFVHRVSIGLDRLEIVYKRRYMGSVALEVIKFQFKGDKGFIKYRSLAKFFAVAINTDLAVNRDNCAPEGTDKLNVNQPSTFAAANRLEL